MGQRNVDWVMERVQWLIEQHSQSAAQRVRTRALLDGGIDGIRALLGDSVSEASDLMPIPPLMHSGLRRLAQKVGGGVPDLKIDPYGYKDSKTAKENAEKRERIVDSYDSGCRLELQIGQVGRWLPGYGFAVWVVKDGYDHDGSRYPYLELRDPYDCYPGPWTVNQQPQELACTMRVPEPVLISMYPEKEDEIVRSLRGNLPKTSGGAVLLGSFGTATWANPGGSGVMVAEYWCAEGTYIVVPEYEILLDFIPNPLDQNRFIVPKRFAFNRLTGHYDHVIGLMAQMTRISILEYIFLEDSVFTETNIYGESLEGDTYRKGRNAVNRLAQGTRVEKPISNLGYQHFQGVDRIERQLRVGASYPVTDDAISPNSWVTGRGLDQLRADVDLEITEYQKVLRWALQDADNKRLEWDDKRNAGQMRALVGFRQGQGYAENYVPSKDINGRYKTRRVYGVMAGWDEPSKIVTGLQLVQGDIIDHETMQENLSGLENISRVNERIRGRKAEETAWMMIQSDAANPELAAMDPAKQMAAKKAVVEIMMEPNKFRDILQKYYTEQGEEMSEEEEAFLQGPEPEMPFGPEPPDITTVLSRLEQGGEIGAGVQTVGRL